MKSAEYLDHIKSRIDKLLEVDCTKGYAYEQIIQLYLGIKNFPVLYYFYPYQYIFRSRINTHDYFFKKIEDIDAPPSKKVKNFARANRPGQSVFYASTDRPTSYLEQADAIVSDTIVGDKISITIGCWSICKATKLILIFNPSKERTKKLDIELGEKFDNFIRSINPSLHQGVKLFFEFISEQYSKLVLQNKDTYLFTTAYSNIVFSNSSSCGIFYPSVQRKGDGYNIAIKDPSIINDNFSLDCVRKDTFICELQENGLKKFTNTEFIEAKNINPSENKIVW